ncbi:ATPases involved in chromosome partitioning-like protein [Magnetococcus marinus MC-1]|uniref:ATPases involved in chromosome partitioning-like protein n=1 Tax=Magnetococcus marinus (strain ATCC BAA-1437 / JCM 17883 / MC-1) TaxID=156889 RepID=A0L9I0_MAGMM|nr:ParA family protein [Magnetococcus marinus]ABK44623.1 ATPases involved in chromosome partitioning-like protein [Magnetococcus marinus MC-1]
MLKICFFHQKGGTGKSTLAMACALYAAQQQQRVMLVDVDNQGTATQWWQLHAPTLQHLPLQVRGQLQESLPDLLPRLADHFDLCFIDAPPSLTQNTLQMLQGCDALIIPTRPSPPDLWALERLALLLHTEPYAKLSHLLVFNQHQGEDLAPLRQLPAVASLTQADEAIPYHPAFAALYLGKPLPSALNRMMGTLLAAFL